MKRIAGLCSLALLGFAASAASAATPVAFEAYAGEPFGVGQVTLDLEGSADPLVLDVAGYEIHEQDGRVLYPAFTVDRGAGRLLQIIRQADRTLSCFFLFQGDEPLRVRLLTPEPVELVIPCQRQPLAHARMLERWWLRYSAATRQQQRQAEYPPLIETYLTAMLGQRLGLTPPFAWQDRRTPDQVPLEVFELLVGTEKLRMEYFERALSGQGESGERIHPVPASIEWPALEVLPPPEPVAVEPIAEYVPADSFYIRFGRFNNYLWLKHFLESNGADLRRLLTQRPYDLKLGLRAQQQLGLEETLLAQILGEAVISDVALIGYDLFLHEGPAIGMLFEARNNALLKRNLNDQRRRHFEALAEQGAVEREIEIDGHTVHYFGTPDHRLRSLYAQRDHYHLVTNSLALVRSFLATADAQASLASLPEFQWARYRTPQSADQVAFIYLSSPFQGKLLSAPYQIELRRRIEAETRMTLLALAQWAARAEGLELDDPLALAQAGFLPPAVAAGLPDGEPSRPNAWLDPQRGARGSFVPIPDMALERVTAAELAMYTRLVEYHRRYWPQMDPLEIVLTRTHEAEVQRTRLSLDARMLPFNKEKYGRYATLFGPETTRMVRPSPHDVISVQAYLQGGLILPGAPPHHVFLGVRDVAPRTSLPEGPILRALQLIRTTPAYLGAWPKPGLLDLLPLPAEATDVYNVMVRLPLGLWRWQDTNGFSVLSFHPDILEDAVRQLGFQEAEKPAQLRVDIGDLANTAFGQWVNELSYERALETSQATARMLNRLSEQFRIPRSQAMERASELLSAEFVCPLGGSYDLYRPTAQHPLEYWASTAWHAERPLDGQPQNEVDAPPLDAPPPIRQPQGGPLDGQPQRPLAGGPLRRALARANRAGRLADAGRAARGSRLFPAVRELAADLAEPDRGENQAAKAGYEAPGMAWFRGLSADATMLEDRLILHADLWMDESSAVPRAPAANAGESAGWFQWPFGTRPQEGADEPAEELPPPSPAPQQSPDPAQLELTPPR